MPLDAIKDLDDQSTDIRVAISRYCKQQGNKPVVCERSRVGGFDLYKSTT